MNNPSGNGNNSHKASLPQVIKIDGKSGSETEKCQKESRDWAWYSPITLQKIEMLINFLKQLKKDWKAFIYIFFKPVPNIGPDGSHQYHEFLCTAHGCQKKFGVTSIRNMWSRKETCKSM
jgi:hypothetical protein